MTQRWLRVLVAGWLAGTLLGLLHTFLLGQGGLYATVGMEERIASTSRYAAWAAWAGVVGAIVAQVLLDLGGAVSRRQVRRFPVGRVGLLLYAVAWMPFLGRAILTDPTGPHVAALGGCFVAVLALGWWALRGLRAEPKPPRWAWPRWVWFLLLIALGVDALVLVTTRHGFPSPTPVVEEPLPRLEALRPAAAREVATDRWNVLLLSFDTLRADHLGSYGYERPTSPVLDSLAAQGARFTNAVCQRPKTSPSVATLLTGTYPAAHGIHKPLQVLREENLTWAEILSGAGWTTGAVVTNGNLYPGFRFDQGFDTYRTGHKDAKTGEDLALAWLAEHGDAPDPWFLWVHHTDPHHPYEPDPPFDTFFVDPAHSAHEAEVARYDAEIRYSDHHLGRILSWLREDPARLSRTLVVFTADHGESLGEHGEWYEHGINPFEPAARVPLLVSLPGVLPIQTTDALVGLVDVLPTVLDALGLPVPTAVQGHSFLPVLTGAATQGPRDFVFLEAGYGEHIGPGRTRTLRTATTKYVERLTDWARFPEGWRDLLWTFDARLEGGLASDGFYDLVLDPAEQINLVAEQPEEARRHREQLRAFARRLAERSLASMGRSPEELDPETYESLKSLGYIE